MTSSGTAAQKKRLGARLRGLLRALGAYSGFLVGGSILLALGFLLGKAATSGGPKAAGHAGHAARARPGAKKTIWTCSMHPQVRKDKPGRCPICGMELIPVEEGSEKPASEAGARQQAARPAGSHGGHAMQQPGPRPGAGQAGHAMQQGARPAPRAGKQAGGEEGPIWTCPMHPQIREPKPGSCPICGMYLVPANEAAKKMAQAGKGHAGHGAARPGESPGAGRSAGAKAARPAPWRLKLSPKARLLAEVSTTPVRRGRPKVRATLYGRIEPDERLVRTVTARVAGRVERLYVRFVGQRVRRGQAMAKLYSPELVAAQMEFLQTVRSARDLAKAAGEGSAAEAAKLLEAARMRLLLLGLSRAQVERLEERGRPQTRVTVPAPVGGYVLKLHVREQMEVRLGSPLFTVADLRRVWVLADVYEPDIWLARKGTMLHVRVEGLPGETFQAKVEYVDPVLNASRRTVRLRASLENKDGRLRPGMYVEATVQAAYALNGRKELLLIPAGAPLLTGKRAVVYVEVEPGVYEGREVELGPRVGDEYVVLSGLKEGERVVSQGAFKIDSELQIRGRRSMMNPKPGKGRKMAGHQH